MRSAGSPAPRLAGATARRRALALLSVLVLAAPAIPAAAAQLHVAVAANFFAPLQRLAALFQRASGHDLILSSGSSGQLYAQIVQGAPFDVFLSADTEKPERLERDGLAVPGSGFVYAIGTLVLWSPRPGAVDAAGQILSSGRFRLIGVANPQTAPYGEAAQQVLRRLGLWDRLEAGHRIVLGENITQTWQFAATGGADLAFVALSQVIGSDGAIAGSSWIVPESMHRPIQQAGVILARCANAAAAGTFTAWLRHDRSALALIHAAGYRTVE